MKNKFRIKFIAITMTIVTVLLAVILFSINIINFSRVTDFADSTLNYLASNDGVFPQIRNENESPLPEDPYFTNESPFETRYFVATFDTSGTMKMKSFSITISKEQAQEMLTTIHQGTAEKGYLKQYYRFLKTTNKNNETMILVLDNSRMIKPVETIVTTSYIIAAVGILCSFIIVLILSKWVVQPFIVSDKKQKRFISDAGHELKTPLTIISANNEILEMEHGESEETVTIDKQVKRMAEMIKHLTLLAKMEDSTSLKPSSFDLSETLKEVCSSFSGPFKNQQKELKLEIENNIQIIKDEKSIRQIISVLLDNALKYSLTYTQVSLTNEKNHPVLIICNDANDIKEGNNKEVFERFYRSSNARASSIEGSGIGLSIASDFAKMNKIKLDAYGKNSIFHIKVTF